jgi:hypothetical protein
MIEAGKRKGKGAAGAAAWQPNRAEIRKIRKIQDTHYSGGIRDIDYFHFFS